MKQVICVKWGTAYGPEYVNRLYGMLRRHVTGDFRLVCLTDNAEGLRPEVDAYPLEELGCDFIVHHIGYDERRGIAARGERPPTPLDQLRGVVEAVSIPVQAVGGLSIEQAVRTPEYGAPLVVIGAPLAIDSDSFKTAGGDLEASLRLICEKVHGYGDVHVGGAA